MVILAIVLFIITIIAFCQVFRMHGLSRYGLFAIVVILGYLSMLVAHITTI